jgi:hypothetical protein
MWLLLLFLLGAAPAWAEDLGELSANPFNPNSTSNPFGAGSPFSNQSTTNPFATDVPRLFARLSGFSGPSGFSDSSDGVSDPANKTDQIDQTNEINQFRLSIRRRESLQPQQSTNPYGRGLRIEGR